MASLPEGQRAIASLVAAFAAQQVAIRYVDAKDWTDPVDQGVPMAAAAGAGYVTWRVL